MQKTCIIAEIHAESELIRFGSFINTGPVVFKNMSIDELEKLSDEIRQF